MRSAIVRYTVFFGLAGLILVLDQWTKWLVRQTIILGDSWTPLPFLRPFFNITHWENTGAAFGLFQAGGEFFKIVAVVVAGVIVYYYSQLPPGGWLVRLALSLQLAGALGNLIDRLTRGPVTDFIHFTNFPIFNVADASISTGVALLAVTMLLENRKSSRAAEPPPIELPTAETSAVPLQSPPA